MRCLRIGLVGALFSVAMGLHAPPAWAVDPTPPTQPTSGPGGKGYQWNGAQVTFRSDGWYDHDYWVYQPTGWQGGGSAPSTAPVIVFLHGWGGHARQPHRVADPPGAPGQRGDLPPLPEPLYA